MTAFDPKQTLAHRWRLMTERRGNQRIEAPAA